MEPDTAPERRKGSRHEKYGLLCRYYDIKESLSYLSIFIPAAGESPHSIFFIHFHGTSAVPQGWATDPTR